MGTWLRAALVALALAGAACGGDSSEPTSPPSSGTGETISGRERFGWVQPAANADEFALIDYALYVDGVRRVITGESCNQTSDTTWDCSAPLPGLSAGEHTLQLAAFIESNGELVESPRSPTVRVTVAGFTTGIDAVIPSGGRVESTDGLVLQVDIAGRGLTDPLDLAAAPDGRVFVAERSGRVIVIDTDSGSSSATNVLSALTRGTPGALLSIALARDFAESRIAYVAYGRPSDTGATVEVARVRESAGVFGEASVIASHAVSLDSTAILRAGPDGALYLGIGTGGVEDAAQDLARAPGKILRFTADGSTPDDNPWRSPVFSLGHRDPRGLAWHPETGALFEVEETLSLEEVNAIRAGANYGWPPSGRAIARAGAPAQLLPSGTGVAGVATVTRRDSPLFGDIILSAVGAEDLLRVRIDESGRLRLTARLLQQRWGSIRQVTTVDGTLFAITANAARWGDGQDLLLRITPLN